ncbi:protein DEHYDRATION-INDUCED 19 homolog 2-like isoform X1 [Phoenix dactylifera]|uniref:Protein DEHYDRATION-INDUCED 19 homolog 2-like isoform X1 n=1 Tax=Phoenix dactylifera TaxID=42345 RepID=A0A8B7CE97_PHODC|nr:protein DEHYDRATION-INDUCED 19 homolog 2-like isoform X1 [Phoenix dactylifera]
MEADCWSRFSAASKRHQSVLQSRFDLCLGYEEIDGGAEDSSAEFRCPFCSEDFDIVGLCCHIDEEHPVEAKNGVCPVCASRVGTNMVGHLTVHHASFFKMQCRRRFRKGSSGSHSTLSLLRKDLREGNLQSLSGGSSFTFSPSNAAPDPLLSSFILNFPVADLSKDVKPESLNDKTSDEKAVESVGPSLSKKDKEERTWRSKFVQELVLSTIFGDSL